MKTNKKTPIPFDPDAFLNESGVARSRMEFRKKEKMFSQGDPCKNMMYIQKGEVKISVVSKSGREAVLGIRGTGEFIGEGGLSGQSVRMATATAMTPVTVQVIDNKEMVRVLHVRAFADRFIGFMLQRNARGEEDLTDQLFNSSEKRLARALLLLARFGRGDKAERVLPNIPQDTLAEMVGSTRSRINFFMNKFRRMGFIKYNAWLHVNTALLGAFLNN
jgi:CRP/FNR family transcriptional regulator, cyclic AMP receptor protein